MELFMDIKRLCEIARRMSDDEENLFASSLYRPHNIIMPQFIRIAYDALNGMPDGEFAARWCERADDRLGARKTMNWIMELAYPLPDDDEPAKEIKLQPDDADLPPNALQWQTAK